MEREGAGVFHLQGMGVHLRTLADLAAGFSGAEIEQAIISGLFKAFATDARLTAEVLANELRDTGRSHRIMSERLDGCEAGRAIGRFPPMGRPQSGPSPESSGDEDPFGLFT